MSTSKGSKELQVAETIVGVLPAGSVVRICSDDRLAIRYAVRGGDMKLRQIVLERASLRRLVDDPAGMVKIEYLQRDLKRSAARRTEFRYPREVRRITRRVREATARALASLTAAVSAV